MPNQPDSYSEKFALTRGMKCLLSFGLVFFFSGFLISVALCLIPSFNKFPVNRWICIASAVGYAIFAVLFIQVFKKRNDYVEASERGIKSHSVHRESIELSWNEITSVEEYLQGACLKLRSADGRRIRIEYQFNNLQYLLNLLEQNLTSLGKNTEATSFRKCQSYYTIHIIVSGFFAGFAAWTCMLGIHWGLAFLLFTLPTVKALLTEPLKVTIKPTAVSLHSAFRQHVIPMDNISDIRLSTEMNQHGVGCIEVLITERRSGVITKLNRFRSMFQLHMMLKNNHAETFDT